MPSHFDAALEQADAIITTTFGDATGAIIRPRTVSEYKGAIPDPMRAAASIYGVFSAGPGTKEIRGNSKGDFGGSTRLATYAAEFWISATEAARPGYAFKKGDLIQFPARPSEPDYAIVAIHKVDDGCLNLLLGADDQPEEAP